MVKNDIVQLTVTDMSDEGLGIGRAETGMTVFVKDSLVGDALLVRITKVMKTYAFGRVEQVVTPSPDRVAPHCPVSRACGGCQIQEMAYPAQLRMKERKVRNNLSRIGKVTFADERESASDLPVFEPIIGMEDSWHYRNKAEYPVGRDRDGKLIAGFYAGRTHTVIDGRGCVIGIEENQAILAAVMGWMERYHVAAYDEQTGGGIIRNVMIRCGFATGQIMVVLAANAAKLPHEKDLVEQLQALTLHSAPRRIVSIVLNTNTERTNVILGRRNRVLYGPGFIEDRIEDLTFRISPLSFYQVNPVQTEKLYRTALEYAGLNGNETVWDLYCGTGTISLFLARHAKRVYGVEVIPQAIDNARENAERNHIGNAEFMVGKAEEVLPREVQEKGASADVIVVDPPRKGLDPKVIETIVKMQPDRVVYVSCNSSTLARDVKLFSEGGYEVRKARPVDMFPHSVHVETVALLIRNN